MEIVQYTSYKVWDDVNYEFRLVQGNNFVKNGIIRYSGFRRNEGTFIIFKLEI